MLSERNKVSTTVFNEKRISNEKTEDILEDRRFSIRLGDKLSELSLTNNAISESGNVGCFSKKFYIHAVKVLVEFKVMTLVQVSKIFASHKAVLALS